MAKNTVTETRFLFAIVYPYKYIAILIILFSLLGSAFDAISIGILVPLLSHIQQLEGQGLPKVFRWLVVWLQSYPIQQQLYWSIAFVILASLLKNAFIALSIRLGHWLSTRLLADLRLRAIRLLMNVGIAYHNQSRVGDLIDRAVSNTGGVESLIRIGIEFIANTLTFVVLFALLFLLSWQLTLVTILLGAVFFGLMRGHTRRLLRMGETAATTSRGVLSAVHEALSGIQLIKSYSQEQRQIPWLYEKVEANRKEESRRRFKIFSIHPITDMYATIAIAALVVIAMQMYRMNTKLMLTQLLPFMYILLRMVPLLKILNNQRAEIVGNWRQVSMVYELLREDNKPFLPDGEKICSGLRRDIQFRAVTFAYPGHDKPAIKEVTFTMRAGETTAIIGESGAGKSTIAHLLLRLYDPQQGAILLDGEPLTNFQLGSYHRRIGVVSQDTFLFNETIKFNIAFSAADVPSTKQIITAAQKAGAHEFILDLPDGYDTLIGDRGVRLSGGQRQRLAIARAILCDPQILILDEATSALDTQTERHIHEAIVELSQGRTVIIIAHRLSTIRNADQIVVLKHGQVAEVGHAEQLLARRGEYYLLAKIG